MSPQNPLKSTDISHLWHPFTQRKEMQNGDFPIITHAKGAYLYEESGKGYFDATSSWWCMNLGHSHPSLLKALHAQVDTLQHTMLAGLSHPPIIHLSKALAQKTKLPYLFYASDGASAVECALRMAVEYHAHKGDSKRTRFLSLENGYHGDTLGAVGVGYVPSFHESLAPVIVRALSAKVPSYFDKEGEEEASAVQALETLLEVHHREIAAIIVEPLIQGAAGVRFYPASYLKKIDALAKHYGLLLMVDEIAVGYGRTGTFFAHEQADITPDILIMGKGMTGGYLPMSALAVSETIYQGFDSHTFFYGHTYTGNPLAAATALAVLDCYKTEGILEGVRENAPLLATLTEDLREHLQRLMPTKSANLGAVGALYLGEGEGKDNTKTGEKKGAKKGATLANAIAAAARKEGVWIRPLSNTLYVWAPLNTSEAELIALFDKLKRALFALSKGL